MITKKLAELERQLQVAKLANGRVRPTGGHAKDSRSFHLLERKLTELRRELKRNDTVRKERSFQQMISHLPVQKLSHGGFHG
jgi:hypothetical protein